jgi:ABC-2 type transport system ATP-binding protein
VIGRGRLIADLSVDEFIRRHSRKVVLVRSPQATELAALIAVPDVSVRAVEPGQFEVEGLTAEQIGDAAAANGFVLHQLTSEQASLEDAFMSLTQDELEFHASRSIPETEKEEALAA